MALSRSLISCWLKNYYECPVMGGGLYPLTPNTNSQMAISLQEIQEVVQKKASGSEITAALLHEARIRLHAESFMTPKDAGQPLQVFLEWVRGLLPTDKYATFVNLMQFPLGTVELSDRIFSSLERVFEGKDPSEVFEFKEAALKSDWAVYRKTVLNEPTVWKKEGWDIMRTAINSVLIVDLPKGPVEGERPAPYFYFLPIGNVIAYKMCRKHKIEYIIFRSAKDTIAVFDDTSYRTFQFDDEKNKVQGLLSESFHTLGYCPASFFWGTPLLQSKPGIKKSPLSSQLANFDWLLFFSTSKKHLDLYAPYPIYSTYEADCDFKNNETGDYCDGGFLRDSTGTFKMNPLGSGVLRCPVCSQKRIVGVGSLIEVPIPEPGGADLRDAVKITTIDIDSLNYNVAEVKRLEEHIRTSVVGMDTEPGNKTSMNEMQISAGYDSRRDVLLSIKDNFEAAKKFVDDTCCRLRYGDSFIGSSISMGTEFYLYSVSEVQEQYTKAKANGASNAELDALDKRIEEAQNRTNPSQSQRAFILRNLEPYRNYTLAEVIGMSDKGLLDPELVRIKLNFNDYINRFERENTSILEFGSQINFASKIDKILNTLKQYGNKQTTEIKPDEPIG